MTALKLHRPSKFGIRLSLCLPLFLISCVVLNVSVVLWWVTSAPEHPKIPAAGNPAAFERSYLSRRHDNSEETDAEVEEEMANQAHEMNPFLDELPAHEPEEGGHHLIEPPLATIAHVVSLIKCSKSVTGFLDAAAVFRHSIHRHSYHAGKSKYDYRMYAIIHEQCQHHAVVLERLGYTVLIKPPLISVSDIQGKWYRDHVESENCCGSAEFVKLYAYELTDHPIVVHWDMDVALLKPMDDLFDSMLYEKSSPEGQAARARLELQHIDEPLPDRIDAYFTRDITSARPWERVQGVQGGFLVARPNRSDLEIYKQFILLGNFTAGRGDGTGWNGLGYGGFQGAMAYQGVVAFFYDHFKPNTAVELAVCRWNQVVADVLWRGPLLMEHHLQCREHPKDGNYEANTKCEDCRVTPLELVKSVHYTACKKPWECVLPYPRKPQDAQQQYRLNHLTNVTTCGHLFTKWFALRQDLEDELQRTAGVEPAAHEGGFHPEFFMGYCSRQGRYIPMNPPPDGFDMKQIYGI